MQVLAPPAADACCKISTCKNSERSLSRNFTEGFLNEAWVQVAAPGDALHYILMRTRRPNGGGGGGGGIIREQLI